MSLKKTVLALGVLVLLFTGCEEKQNKISRYVQNWTGVNGVLAKFAQWYQMRHGS